MKMSVVAFLLVLSLLCAPNIAQETINLGFIYSGSGQYVTAGVQPAVELAIELINNRSNLLPGYRLALSYTGDSQCEPAQSQEVFFEPQLAERTGPDNIAIVGCGCSLATVPIAEVSQYWNMIHMSYASSSDILSNTQLFPNFWRTYPRESRTAESLLALMNHYNWTKLKIITQDEPLFFSSTFSLNNTLSANNIAVVTEGVSSFRDKDNVATMDGLFVPEVRVYMLNMYPRHARRVLCAAARAREGEVNETLRYEKYVWITLGWYTEGWWRVEREQDPTLNCTDADVEQFLPNTVAILQANTADNASATTDVLLTAEEFEVEYRRRLEEGDLVYEHSAFHAYDAIWTLARAMDSYIRDGGDLSNYTRYNGNSTYLSIESYLRNTSFVGVSGPVMLDSSGTRIADHPMVLKYRNSTVTNNCGKTGPGSIERVQIAYVEGNNGSFVEYLDCEDDSTSWPGGVPVDGRQINQTITILPVIVGIYYFLATIGLTFVIVCLLFNLVFRNRKIVKLISPNLNYVLLFGCCLMYIAMFFFVFPSLNPLAVTFACHIRLWLQLFGYFFAFGIVLFKMWRVYYIFRTSSVSKKRRSRIPKDWQLFLGVCCCVLVLVVIFTFVGVFGGYRAVLQPDNEFIYGRDDNGTLVRYLNPVCKGRDDGRYDIIWIGIGYGFILISNIVAVVLAFLTRKVEIKALNDYKYISIIAYMSFFILIGMILSAYFLEDYQNADAAVFSTILFIYSTLLLSLTFIPKMVILYKDPKGDKIFQRSMSQAGTILVANNQLEDSSSRYIELEQHCKDLEGRLARCGEVVPTFRPRSESSFKLMSTSFSSVPPSSPLGKVTHPSPLSASVPTTPTHSVSTQLKVTSSDYFTEPERNSTASSTDPKNEIEESIVKTED